MQAAQLAPLGVGEILDVAIKIYWRNAPTLFRLVFLVVAPVQALSVLIFSSALPDVAVLGGGSGLLQQQPTTQLPLFESDELWTIAAGLLMLLTLTIIAGAVSTAACFKAITDAYLEAAPEWKSSLRFAASRLLSVVWVTLLTGLVLALPFLPVGVVIALLVAAGADGGALVAVVVLLLLAAFAAAVWLYVSVQVSVPALLTEELRGTKALRRSGGLVRGRWWQTFLILVLGGLLASIVSGAISGLLTAVTFTDLGDSLLPSLVLNAIGTTIATVLTTPFTAAFITVLYFDLRVRKEGFDLELLAQRVGVDPPTGAGFATTPHSRPPATDGSQPPYWPPPPGWRPSAEDPPQS
ncbi:MAG: hypothetical protein H0W29_10200 [Gemmatimonadales bacterium]|nr:hypothetical protein [Gemmatimonadales bacterium]